MTTKKRKKNVAKKLTPSWVKIMGYSDDNVAVEWSDGANGEVGAYSNLGEINAHLIVEINGERFATVAAIYTGFWSFAVAPFGEVFPENWDVKRERSDLVTSTEVVKISCSKGKAIRVFILNEDGDEVDVT